MNKFYPVYFDKASSILFYNFVNFLSLNNFAKLYNFL